MPLQTLEWRLTGRLLGIGMRANWAQGYEHTERAAIGESVIGRTYHPSCACSSTHKYI